MLESIITSQTRIKLLLKFFLNSKTSSHLRGLESEFGESTNGIRIELNRLEAAKLLSSHREGNKKLYSANKTHPLFDEIHKILIKQTGLDKVIEDVVEKIGSITSVYLIGELAKGHQSDIIELVIIGEGIDLEYLERKVAQCENLVDRKVDYHLFTVGDANEFLMDIPPSDLLLIWNANPGNGSMTFNEPELEEGTP